MGAGVGCVASGVGVRRVRFGYVFAKRQHDGVEDVVFGAAFGGDVKMIRRGVYRRVRHLVWVGGI